MSEGTGEAWPLVSVVIRSMDRPTLTDALASLAAQNYPRLEAVVVNARGGTHSALPAAGPGRDFRLVNQHGAGLGRALACNVGLDAVAGDWVIFLDDDDLLLPKHLSRLVAALRGQSTYRAAYAGVQVEGSSDVYDRPYDRAALLAGNFLPIHAVLFARSLLAEGCRVDTDLPLFEDWDFWLQVAQLTDYLHVPGVSAVYRRDLGASGHASDADARGAALTTFYRRWHLRVDSSWWAAASLLLDQQRMALADYAKEQSDLRAASEREISRITDLLAAANFELRAMRLSFSWRVTAPLRLIRALFAGGYSKK